MQHSSSPSCIPDALQTFKNQLRRDGCQDSRIEQLCVDQVARITKALSPASLLLRVQKVDSLDSLLFYLPIFVREMVESGLDQTSEAFSVMREKFDQYLLSSAWRLTSPSVSMNIFRQRELLLLFITKQEFRDFLLTFLQGKTVTSECSYFASMYYTELQNLFPGDKDFFSVLDACMVKNRDHIPLFALNPKDAIPSDFSHRPFTMSGSTAIPFWESDDVVQSLSAIVAHRRSDRQFTACFPQAEAYHSSTAFSSSSENRTYVFSSNGILLGSVKHGDDREGSQQSFLGMRTVHNPDLDTFPLIEGGLYLMADDHQRQYAVEQQNTCRIDRLALMPLRPIGGSEFFPENDFIDRIRERRRVLEHLS